jgi:hypothetical protein|uniref:Uncharacterized protein n=1 Tax=Cyanidiaceae sp. MX-AZ01 TaxID=1503164 RepID=A0A060AE57_9RHOD|nr:hypothetical protein [Cyanidiaceae sp. MX-AZ01]
MIRYYFVSASRDFLIHQEAVEEILRERSQYYMAKGLKKDFAIFEGKDANLMYIVSTDLSWIEWLQLRLQYVQKGHFDLDYDILNPKSKSYQI